MICETHKIERPGFFVNCRVEGKQDAPWLMFSNSLLTDLSLWDEQVAAFSDRFRILRYDQRGHGGTGLSDEPVRLDVLVDDVLAVLDWLGVERVAMIGASMGAATSLCLASRAPGRVRAVVAADGQAKTAPGGAQAWQERIDYAKENGMAAVRDVTMPRWFGPGFLSTQRSICVGKMMQATPLEGYIACAQALQHYDFTESLTCISQPVLLLVGANDGNMPKTMAAMSNAIPDACFYEIADAGHLPSMEQPEVFNASVMDFITRLA